MTDPIRLPAPLILATRSPRRMELGRRLGLDFMAVPADIEERPEPGEAPAVYAERLARDKAAAIAAEHPAFLVLGCDTIVVLGDEILEKPADEADAVAMLERLSGREHQVLSGLALIWREGNRDQSCVETTTVRFRKLDPSEVQAYVDTAEPMDKAGAYGIQGGAGKFVDEVQGSYDNVVGLPTERLLQMLSNL